jgi:hypothetical protein
MGFTPDYEEFLRDGGAMRFFLVNITYKNSDGSTGVLRVSDRGWNTDGDEDPPHTHWRRTLLQGLNVESSLLQQNGLFGGCAVPTFGAVVLDNRDGEYDWLAEVSVDEQDVEVLMVGWMQDGRLIRYTDAAANPIHTGVGIDKPPQPGDTAQIFVRSRLGLLEREALPELYAPQCVLFPGSSTEFIDLGDVFDLPNGSWYVEGFFYCDDPSLTGQFLIDKTDFASGWYFDVGTGGNGVVRAVVLGQTPNGTTSAADVVKTRRWTHFAIVNDSGAGTRRIVFDGTTVISTSSVTGNANNNGHTFKIGRGFKGRISYLRAFSGLAPSDATIRASIYVPRTGTEASLLFDLRLSEGTGRTIRNFMTGGATVSNALSTGLEWVSSAWIGGKLAGKKRRQILGEVRDVPLDERDPGKLIYESGIGPVWGITPYSMAVALAGGSFTNDLTRGITTLAAGTTFGKLTADVSGISPNGPALLLDGVDDYGSCTQTCPAGAMSFFVIFETRSVAAATRAICGWRNGTAAGRRTLTLASTGPNRLSWMTVNDAATPFTLNLDGVILDNEFAAVVGTLNPTAGRMRLYVNGELKGEIAVSGTFNTTLTAFAAGRLPDLTSPNHLDGRIDCLGIFSKELTLLEAQTLSMRGLVANDSGLMSGWSWGTDLAPAATNLIGAQPAMTLNGGATYGPSRTTVLDIAIYLLTRRGVISADLVDPALACAMLRDLPGQAGWVFEDDRDELAHLSEVLASHGAALVEDSSVFRMDIVRGGSAGADTAPRITERAVTADQVTPVAIHRAVYGIAAGYRRTFEVYNREDLASIAESNPTRYKTATEPYQWAPQKDTGILEHYPGAEIIPVKTALLYERDADRLARLLLPIYQPPQQALAITLDTDAAGIRLMAAILLAVRDIRGSVLRWGGELHWQIVEFQKEETRYQLTIWLRPE